MSKLGEEVVADSCMNIRVEREGCTRICREQIWVAWHYVAVSSIGISS